MDTYGKWLGTQAGGERDPGVIRKLLNGLRFGATNDGPLMMGMPSANPLNGSTAAPAFGASAQVPNTGLSLYGQYQRYPQSKPSIGFGLRYGLDY